MKRLGFIPRLTVLLLAAAITLYPLLWMAFTSLKTNAQIHRQLWLPDSSPTLANYQVVWESAHFWRFMLNSLAITGGTVAILLFLGALAGYGFGRFDFRGKHALWLLFLGGLFLPVHATLIPLHRLQATLGMTRGWYSLAFLGAIYLAFNLSFTVYFLRGFFTAIPDELEDAARVDGCTSFGVFWRVMLPLSLPALTVTGLINAVMIWNEFIFALVLLHDTSAQTLPRAVMRFSDETSLDLALTTAALSLTVFPVIVLFIAGQRWIIRGLTAGAIKG